jgi:hypothetical protein
MSNQSNFENDVRTALHTIDTEPPLNPEAVIRQGRSIRNRRRVTIGAAAVLAAAAVATPATLLHLGSPSVSTAANPTPSRSAPAVSQPVDMSGPCPAAGVKRTPPRGARPLAEYWNGGGDGHVGGTLDPAQPQGTVVCTGEFGTKGEAIIYLQPGPNGEGKPGTALWEGRRDDAGKYSGYFQGRSYDFTGKTPADLTPGFHSLTSDAWDNFIFGVYVGPVAKVDFTVVGKKMPTHVQPWSGHQNVSLVWFRIPAGTNPMRIYGSIQQKPGDVKIAVQDANGQTLPLGDTEIGAL